MKAAKALYRLLLLELASEGYPLKPPSLTPLEFTQALKENPFQANEDSHGKVQRAVPHTSKPERLLKNVFNLEVYLERFAALYTELCYRSRISEQEREEKVNEMRTLYTSIRNRIRRKGVLPCIVRALSLRGLRYSW